MSRRYAFRGADLRGLSSFGAIDKNVQIHLKNVYSTLCIGFISAFVAAYAYQVVNILQSWATLVSVLSFFITLASALYIYFTPHSSRTLVTRTCAFVLFAFSTGLGLGPLLHLLSIIDPQTIPTALLGTAIIFASFSLTAILTRKRYFLFLGAVLMSATSMLASFNFMNLFLRSPAIYQAELYIGFAIFCGFVVFDTQLIIEKRKSGDTDFVWYVFSPVSNFNVLTLLLTCILLICLAYYV
ncbi:unnamed protein product [Dicrocoelium dendriticum]|nr:unnamed protein product [Dicrocoelium dendriticum]